MTSAQLAWPVIAAAALVLFWAPVAIAAIRGTDPVGTVALLTMLTLLLPPAWFVALAAPFFLPRKDARRPYRTMPPYLAGRPPARAVTRPVRPLTSRPSAGSGRRSRVGSTPG
jgi:hypothetical protein